MKIKSFSKLFLFCVLVLIIGCKKNIQNDNPYTFLALGDSYTAGESVPDTLSWPFQLINQLNKNKILFKNPKILAKTGWTTDELISAIDSVNLEGKFDYVSLLIGVNNQYRGLDISNFKVEFNELLEMAISFSGDNKQNVKVLSIPDWGVMPFAFDRDQNKITKEINEYNFVKEKICLEKGIDFIDITSISREAKFNPSLVGTDSLHPSDKMYSIWVKKMIPYFALK